MKRTALVPTALALLVGVMQKELVAGYVTLNAPNATHTIPTGISGNNIVGTYYDGTGAHGFLYNGFHGPR